MKLKHYILIVLSLLVVLIIYNTPIRKPDLDRQDDQQALLDDNFSFEAFQAERLEKLEPEAIEQIAELQTEIANLDFPENKALHDSLISKYLDYGEVTLAADVATQKAQKTGLETDWLSAAEFYRIELLKQQHRHPYYFFLSNRFRQALETAKGINPDNLETQVDLAALMMEDEAKVMDGVNILLSVVEKSPEHPEANLLLGRFGIVSGQYDRAIGRLETVILAQPGNAEAYFFLGEAYYAKGKVAKAIEMFELCKSLVDDPEFERELTDYINRISKN